MAHDLQARSQEVEQGSSSTWPSFANMFFESFEDALIFRVGSFLVERLYNTLFHLDVPSFNLVFPKKSTTL